MMDNPAPLHQTTYPLHQRAKTNVQKQARWGGIIAFLLGAMITGAVGYIFGGPNDHRKAQLDFVNAQIERLYGPLYALTQANNEIWNQFRNSEYWRTGSSPAISSVT